MLRSPRQGSGTWGVRRPACPAIAVVAAFQGGWLTVSRSRLEGGLKSAGRPAHSKTSRQIKAVHLNPASAVFEG